MIDSQELFTGCYADKASLDLQPIIEVLALLYSYELCRHFSFQIPCLQEIYKWNESVTVWVENIGRIPARRPKRFCDRSNFIGERFSGVADTHLTFLLIYYAAMQCLMGSDELKNMAQISDW